MQRPVAAGSGAGMVRIVTTATRRIASAASSCGTTPVDAETQEGQPALCRTPPEISFKSRVSWT